MYQTYIKYIYIICVPMKRNECNKLPYIHFLFQIQIITKPLMAHWFQPLPFPDIIIILTSVLIMSLLLWLVLPIHMYLGTMFLVLKIWTEITNLDTQRQGSLINEGRLGRLGKDKWHSLVSAFQKVNRISLWKLDGKYMNPRQHTN